MKEIAQKTIKLTGKNSIVKFSKDGSLVAVGAYDGGFKVFDVDSEKSVFKTKIKGPKRNVIIHNIDLSFDNKYGAFSCLSKVYVVDFLTQKIIKEVDYDLKLERQLTVPFCFFNQTNKLAIPNGKEILLYDIDTAEKTSISLFEGTGTTEMIAISPNDQYLAYKSMHHKICDQLFIYNIAKKELLQTIDLPYEYIPAQQMFACHFRFVENEMIGVMRQSYGFSVFDIQTGKENKAVTWNTMGFRSMGSYNYRISKNGRYLLINKETSSNVDDNLQDWSISGENCVFVVYDTKALQIIYSVKNGTRSADFNMEKNVLVIQHYDWEQENRNRQTLKIFEIDTV